jgi:hypothetical protein
MALCTGPARLCPRRPTLPLFSNRADRPRGQRQNANSSENAMLWPPLPILPAVGAPPRRNATATVSRPNALQSCLTGLRHLRPRPGRVLARLGAAQLAAMPLETAFVGSAPAERAFAGVGLAGMGFALAPGQCRASAAAWAAVMERPQASAQRQRRQPRSASGQVWSLQSPPAWPRRLAQLRFRRGQTTCRLFAGLMSIRPVVQAGSMPA